MPGSSLAEEINFSPHGLSTYSSNSPNDPTVGEVRLCVCVWMAVKAMYWGFPRVAMVCVCVASDKSTQMQEVENTSHKWASVHQHFQITLLLIC